MLGDEVWRASACPVEAQQSTSALSQVTQSGSVPSQALWPQASSTLYLTKAAAGHEVWIRACSIPLMVAMATASEDTAAEGPS